jgi:hypothetical protein
MHIDIETSEFIKAQFSSIWELEVLLFLWAYPTKLWSKKQLISEIRANDYIITAALRCLHVGGLIVIEEQGVRYDVASSRLDHVVRKTAELYRTKPHVVRKIIIHSSSGALSAFSNAFNFRRKS